MVICHFGIIKHLLALRYAAGKHRSRMGGVRCHLLQYSRNLGINVVRGDRVVSTRGLRGDFLLIKRLYER